MSRTIDSSSPSASTPAAASTQDLLRFERLMSGLSATFINLPAHEMDRAIEASLARIVAALRIDRSSLASREEALVVDERSELRPAQVVESKLTRMLENASVPVSHLQMRGLLRHR